jgi:chromosome segregation ATPase
LVTEQKINDLAEKSSKIEKELQEREQSLRASLAERQTNLKEYEQLKEKHEKTLKNENELKIRLQKEIVCIKLQILLEYKERMVILKI